MSSEPLFRPHYVAVALHFPWGLLMELQAGSEDFCPLAGIVLDFRTTCIIEQELTKRRISEEPGYFVFLSHFRMTSNLVS